MDVGRPPLSHATAETAVATLKESHFKAELQKGLEECKAELVAERRAAPAHATTPKEACNADCTDARQAAKSKAQTHTEAMTAEPADSGQPTRGRPSAAKEACQAEPADSGQAAMGSAETQSEALRAEPGVTADSGQAAKAAPMAAKEVPQAVPAGDGWAVTGASQAAATMLRLQPLEVPEDNVLQASDTLSSRGRPPLRSAVATGRSPGSGAQIYHRLMGSQSAPSHACQQSFDPARPPCPTSKYIVHQQLIGMS